MEAKLQAGIELTLEKTARESAGIGYLAQALHGQASAAGIAKRAGHVQDQGVVQEHASSITSPSSGKSQGMEDKNDDYGKGSEYKLDDDPSKAGGSQQTGKTHNVVPSNNITSEGSGMPNLEIGSAQHKQASANTRVLTTMLRTVM